MATDRNIDVRLKINATNLAGGAVQSLNTQVGALAATSEKLAKSMQSPAFAGTKFLAGGQDNAVALTDALKVLQQGLREAEKDSKKASNLLSPMTPIAQTFKQIRAETRGLGEEVTSFALNAIPNFVRLQDSIGLVETLLSGTKGTLSSKVGSVFFESISKAARQVTQEVAPLSDLIKGLGGVASPALGGFTGVGDPESIIKSIESQLGGRNVKKLGIAIPNNNLAIDKRIGVVAEKLSNDIVEGVDIQFRGRNIPLRLPKLTTLGNLAKRLTKGAREGLDERLEMPFAPPTGSSPDDAAFFARSNKLRRPAREALRAPDVSLVGDAVNDVFKQILKSTLNEFVAPALQQGFRKSFTGINQFSGRLAQEVTAKGIELSMPDMELQGIFNEFDNKNKQQASQLIDSKSSDLVKRFTNQFGAAKVFPPLFEYLFTYVPASTTLLSLTGPINNFIPGLGHAITTMGDDYFGALLKSIPGFDKTFPALGRNIANRKFVDFPGSKNINNFYNWLDSQRGRGGAFGKLAGDVADYGFRSVELSTAGLFGEIADNALVNPLLSGLTKNTSRNIVGAVIKFINRLIGTHIPDSVKRILADIIQKVPEQLSSTLKTLGVDAKRIMGNFGSAFVQSRYQERVLELQDKLITFDPDALTRKANRLRRRGGESEAAEGRGESIRQNVFGALARVGKIASSLDVMLKTRPSGDLTTLTNGQMFRQFAEAILRQAVSKPFANAISEFAKLNLQGIAQPKALKGATFALPQGAVNEQLLLAQGKVNQQLLLRGREQALLPGTERAIVTKPGREQALLPGTERSIVTRPGRDRLLLPGTERAIISLGREIPLLPPARELPVRQANQIQPIDANNRVLLTPARGQIKPLDTTRLLPPAKELLALPPAKPLLALPPGKQATLALPPGSKPMLALPPGRTLLALPPGKDLLLLPGSQPQVALPPGKNAQFLLPGKTQLLLPPSSTPAFGEPTIPTGQRLLPPAKPLFEPLPEDGAIVRAGEKIPTPITNAIEPLLNSFSMQLTKWIMGALPSKLRNDDIARFINEFVSRGVKATVSGIEKIAIPRALPPGQVEAIKSEAEQLEERAKLLRQIQLAEAKQASFKGRSDKSLQTDQLFQDARRQLVGVRGLEKQLTLQREVVRGIITKQQSQVTRGTSRDELAPIENLLRTEQARIDTISQTLSQAQKTYLKTREQITRFRQQEATARQATNKDIGLNAQQIQLMREKKAVLDELATLRQQEKVAKERAKRLEELRKITIGEQGLRLEQRNFLESQLKRQTLKPNERTKIEEMLGSRKLTTPERDEIASSLQAGQGADGAALQRRLAGAKITTDEIRRINALFNQEINRTLEGYRNVPDKFLGRIQEFVDRFPELAEKVNVAKIFENVDNYLEGTLSSAMAQVNRTMTIGAAQGVVAGVANRVLPAIDVIDGAVMGTVTRIRSIPQTFGEPAKAAASFFNYFQDQPIKIFSQVGKHVTQASNSIFMMTQQFAMLGAGIQGLRSIVQNSPLGKMVQQNAEFESQVLTIQSGLISTNRIIAVGANAIANYQLSPASAIQNSKDALKGAKSTVEEAIAYLRVRSLEISKITSSDLIEPFLNVINQSGQLGLSVKQSADLAIGFSAAMTTLNVPIQQSRQEIQSVLTGYITHNSMVAKTLGITNTQIRTWKDQGRVYEELMKKLEPLTTGQAEVAKTLGGLTSNVAEYYQEIGRQAGVPLMGFVKEEVENVYLFVKKNKDSLTEEASLFISEIVRFGKLASDLLRTLAQSAGSFGTSFPLFLLRSAVNIFELLVESIKTTLNVLKPFISVAGELMGSMNALGGPILKLAIQFKTLHFGVIALSGGFGLLSRTLPVVGGLMSFVTLRSLPLIGTFSNVSRALTPTAAGFLLLTKHAKQIPGAMGLVTRSFSQFGILAPAMASISPMLAGIGINAAGLARSFGPLQKILTGLPLMAVPALQGVINAIQGDVKRGIPSNALLLPFVDILKQGQKELVNFNSQVANGSVGTTLFGNTIRTASSELRKWLITTTLLTAGLYATFVVIDKFIIKNQQNRETVLALADGVKTLVVNIFQIIPAAAALSVAITGLAVSVSGGAIAFGTLLPTVTLVSAILLGGLKAVDAYEGRIVAISAALVGLSAFIGGFLVKLTGLGILNSTIPKLLTSLSALSSIRLATLSIQVEKWATSIANVPLPLMKDIGASLADMSAHLSTAGKQFAIAGDASVVGSAKMSAARSGIFALGAAAKSLVLALAPIAVTLAAIGTAALFVAAHKLRKSNEAFEATSRITGGLSLAWIQLRRDLMAAGDAQEERLEAGIALGQKEYEENKKLQGRLRSLVFQTEGQIAQLNERLSATTNAALKRAIQAEIDELTNRMEAYKNAADEITTAPAELRQLGGVFRQLTGDADLFWQAVNNPGGDNDKLAEQAKNLIETTRKQFEMGAIDPAEAKKRLNFLLETTTLGKDARIAAEQAITEIVKQEAERRIAILTTEQNLIQGLMDEGKKGEIEGERELSQSKMEELKIRAQAERDAFEERQRIRNLELQQELDAANKRAESIRAELQKPEMPVPELPQGEVDKLAQFNSQLGELAAKESALDKKRGRRPGSGKAIRQVRAEIELLTRDRDTVQAEISQIESQRSAAIQNNLTDERKQQLEQELKGIEEERGRVAQQLEAAGILDAKNTQKALSDIERQGFAERKKARERENKVLLQNYDEEQATLEQYLRFGETTIKEFNRRELEIAKGRYQQELAILREESSRLGEGNTEAQEAIFARSVEANKKYTEAQRRFWENEGKRLEEDFKQQSVVLEMAVRNGEMTLAESNQRTFELNQARVDQLIEFNSMQLRETFDPAMIQQLIAKEGELYKQRGDIVKQFVESETSRLRDEYATRSAILENALRNNEVTLKDYNEELFDLQRAGLDQQIAFLDEQLAVTTDPRLAQELLIKQQELLKQRLETTNTFIQQETDRITKGFEEQNAALEAAYAKGNHTAQEYNEVSYALTKERIAAQLELIQSQLRLATDPRLIQDLLIKQQGLMKSAMEATNTFIQAETERITKAFDEQNSALEAGYAQGNHTIEEYNQKSYEFIKQRIKAQLELIQGQLRLATDPRMLQQLRTQEQTLLKEQANAYDNFLESQKRQLERRLKEGNDIIKASEVERTRALQQLRNSGDVDDLGENQLKLDSTRSRIQEELKLEQKRIRELQALPTPNDPEKQLEREASIREARVRGSQLEIDLLTNEREQQRLLGDTIAKALQKRVDAIRNATTFETQEMQRVIDLNEIYSKSLENQSKLFEARSNLQSAAGGYIQGQLELLKNVTKSERRQQQIAELTAAIKIRVLQQQIAMEQRVAEIQEQQRRLTLEREKINKRMELGQAQASASEAGMRYQELVARQAINPADVAQSDIIKAQIDLRAAQMEIIKKQNDLVMLDAQGQLDQQISDITSAQKEIERRGRLNQAEAEFANTGSPGKQRRRQRDLERGIVREAGYGDTRSMLAAAKGYITQLENQLKLPSSPPPGVPQPGMLVAGVPQLGESPVPPTSLLNDPQFQTIDINTDVTAQNTSAIQGLTSAIAQLSPEQQARVAGNLATIQGQQRAGLLDMTRSSLQQIAPGYVSQINRGTGGTEPGVAQNMIMGMREEINRLAGVIGQPEFSNQINNYFDTSDLRSRTLQQTATQQTLEAIRDVSRETKRLFR